MLDLPFSLFHQISDITLIPFASLMWSVVHYSNGFNCIQIVRKTIQILWNIIFLWYLMCCHVAVKGEFIQENKNANAAHPSLLMSTIQIQLKKNRKYLHIHMQTIMKMIHPRLLEYRIHHQHTFISLLNLPDHWFAFLTSTKMAPPVIALLLVNLHRVPFKTDFSCTIQTYS